MPNFRVLELKKLLFEYTAQGARHSPKHMPSHYAQRIMDCEQLNIQTISFAVQFKVTNIRLTAIL